MTSKDPPKTNSLTGNFENARLMPAAVEPADADDSASGDVQDDAGDVQVASQYRPDGCPFSS